MAGTFSRIKTWIAEVLTASDLNAEFDNIINNLDPDGIDDASATAGAMQAVADPYPASVESLATNLRGEHQRLRYLIKQITGEAQWYIDPDTDLATHYAATAIHGATGAVVGTTNTQTLTNKTLTTPTITIPVIADFTSATHTHANSAGGGLVTIVSSQLPAGAVVQVVTTQTGAVATGTTIVPNDDTIPQNTEGDQYMTLAITPKSATNKLIIEVSCPMAISIASNHVVGALFQDSTAGALAATLYFIGSANTVEPFVLTHTMTSGTTSATTFKFRAGPETAGTMTVNGLSAARKLGGVSAATIKITEVVA